MKPSSKIYQSTLLITALTCFAFCCIEPDEPDLPHVEDSDEATLPKDATPYFLLTAWIWPLADNSVRTYDFTQMQAAGKRTVEIGAWYQVGAMGWQTNQRYTAAFEATSQIISIVSVTGYQEKWTITAVQSNRMTVTNSRGESYYWFNCNELGWPPLVRASMRACR
jgi:hypothetical protein